MRQCQMRFPVKAPAISHTSNQKLLKPMADPIIGDAQKVGFQLVGYANLISSKECQSRREPTPACRLVGKLVAVVGPTPKTFYQLN